MIRHTKRPAQVGNTSNQKSRKGFTLIELLVVIGIIALLASLTLPALSGARATARKTQCMNNLRSIGQALIAYGQNRGGSGQFPRLVGEDQMNVTDTVGPTTYTTGYPWTVSLLPFLDRNAHYDKLVDDISYDSSVSATDPTSLANTYGKQVDVNVAVFTCVDDDGSANTNNGLSFALNLGYISSTNFGSDAITARTATDIDWNNSDGSTNPAASSTNDRKLTQATGVFFTDESLTTSVIESADGTTSTLMAAENLQAGNWSYSDPASIPRVGRLGFGIEINVTGSAPALYTASTSGVGAHGTSANNQQDLALKLPANFNLGNSEIGTNPDFSDGTAWRPSSNHPGGIVNVVMCDGSMKSLARNMDSNVYARMITPKGTKYGQDVLSDDDF